MDNTLTIDFAGHKLIQLRLFSDGREIDTVDFSFDSNLDTVLIESVDKLLKRNRITILSLREIAIVGQVDPNSSAYKIAQTFIEAQKTLKNE
jgi:hypothetical protein